KNRRNRLLAADLHLTRSGIGQALDVPDALLQFIECSSAARENGAAVNRGRNSVRAAIEKLCAQRVLKVGDQLRHRWLRNAEMRSCLSQTAPLHGRKEHVQIPKPHASADMAVPIDDFGHIEKL